MTFIAFNIFFKRFSEIGS